jgi:hypothetical protein
MSELNDKMSEFYIDEYNKNKKIIEGIRESITQNREENQMAGTGFIDHSYFEETTTITGEKMQMFVFNRQYYMRAQVWRPKKDTKSIIFG